MNKSKLFTGIFGVVVIILLMLSSQILERNNYGHMKVKQSMTGKMSVRLTPGFMFQNFGTITEYNKSERIYLSNDDNDGGSGKTVQAVPIRFNDGGTGDVSLTLQYAVPNNEQTILLIHELYGSPTSFKSMIRKQVIESVKVAASLYKADETYRHKREEFNRISQEMLENGIYQTYASQGEVKIKKDKDGNPVISKDSIVRKFNLDIVAFNVTDIDYDATIVNLINKRKEAEQKKIVAITAAEKAKQDAITAVELGKANVAKAEAEKLVEKIQAVTDAQKEKEVAELKAKQELNVARLGKQAISERSKAKLIAGQADARVKTLLVKAGLTPRERAEYRMKTKIGVANALSKVNLPKIIASGSGGKGGTSAMDAVGLKMMVDLANTMSK